ncbi:MAG TPA: glycoside hydrolase domain-containing protein [Prolixibacteraceae bacterium]|nr:glycoside hydrolase domain-containing protein [Prolixibacteraceae bacterium]
MKNRLLIYMVLILSAVQIYGQEISYSTGQWDPQGLGYHRAVISVSKPAEVVKVKVPWRRLDKVEDKNLIMVDALTGQRINNIYCTEKNKDFGEIVFEPVSGEGEYYLYYMPSRLEQKVWWSPNTEYEKPTVTYDAEWKKGTEGSKDTHIARTIRFESQSDFHSFYPMETPVTSIELSDLLQKNLDKEFLIFPEDRNYPIRMTETVPLRWYEKGANNNFEGKAMKDEAYAWQIGIFAAFKDLNDVKLSFTDLQGDNGSVISKSRLRCINLGGKDYLGNKFIKTVKVSKGEVRSLWIMTDLSKELAAGVYKGKVSLSAKGTKTYEIDVTLKIQDKIAENRGYNTPQNQSRLNWLDSDIGIDNKVVAPFIPVKINNKTISILGRKLTFNDYGLPAKITSSFTESNHSVDGTDRDIISHPIQFDLLQGDKPIQFSENKPKITMQESGLVAWSTVLTSGSFDITMNAKMECDGNVDYVVKVKAKKDIHLDNVKLMIPYEKSVAKYLMGLGVRGGFRPEKVEWKWGQPHNMVWIGDVNAGMQLNLHDSKDWRNEGKGGCNFESFDKECLLTTYTGERTLKEGDEMEFHFALLISPFKTLDDKHWKERYYQNYFSIDSTVAIKNSATIMNIHQGNKYNPYINYPFLAIDKLKPLVNAAKKHNIRVKLYYTVRELTAYTCELWALRQLDNEIFTPSREIKLADTITGSHYSSVSGHPWLFEHLRTNYIPEWHTQPAEDRDWDFAISTQYLSRWHNYYIAGLNWLSENIGIRGLYLDGIGYDREIMKRLRKSLDLASDSCLLDFHCSNYLFNNNRRVSPMNKYMEHLPYVNSLWFGEEFNYNSSPDYWLVEISGIPFGLYGEMLENCGNVYRGMVYGMSSRLAWVGCDPTNIWKLWDYFGISGSTYAGYWDAANPAKTDNKDVLASAYLKKDKVMIALGNWTDKEKKVSLELDWKKLGMDSAKAKIVIPQIENLQGEGVADIKNLIIPASKGLILIISQ